MMTYREIAAGLSETNFSLRGDGLVSLGGNFFDPKTSSTWSQAAADAARAHEDAELRNKAVNTERARRLKEGWVFNVTGGASPIALTGDETTKQNLQALAFAASLRISAGDTTTITRYRDAVNVDHSLTPPQVVELFSISASWVSAVYAASWDLKATTPAQVPDVTLGTYWP